MKKISATIIGLSALGKPTLTLLLRYLTIAKLVLIDPDTWQPNEQRKHIHSQRTDTGKAKINTARYLVQSFDPRTKIEAIGLPAQTAKAQKAMRKTSIIISCVDNDTTRLDLQVFAADNNKIFLDMGAQIIRQERIGTIRIYIPGKTPCIVCQGLNLENVMTDTLREAKIKAGYLAGTNKNPRSVAILDTATAAIGISLLIDHIENKQGLPTTLSYNQTKQEITKLTFTRKDNCKICRTPTKEPPCQK